MENQFEVVVEQGLFGIREENVGNIVPCVHETKEAAVADWAYGEVDKTDSSRFTIAEIFFIKNQLLKQVII